MAAGMGSRFGTLKQIEPVGPNGELILDYSVRDAAKAGFDKVIFVIKPEIEDEFREIIGARIEKQITAEYVFQQADKLPDGFSLPQGRVKPWGTCHALLAARDAVDTPFAVINADDFYGENSFKMLNKHLKTNDEYAMVAFDLFNTLTDFGTVTRGVCRVADGYLESVEECRGIDKNCGLPKDTVVSMNMWGFTPRVFADIEHGFAEFLANCADPMTGEYVLPDFVGERLAKGLDRVKVYKSVDKWYGVTYREDLPGIRDFLKDK